MAVCDSSIRSLLAGGFQKTAPQPPHTLGDGTQRDLDFGAGDGTQLTSTSESVNSEANKLMVAPGLAVRH